MNKVKLCKFCKKHGTYRESKGYTNEWDNDLYICPDCKHQMVDVDYPSKDFDIITKISFEPSFIESMIELRKKNSIEYQAKMTQFKIQIAEMNKENIPKCPTCSSTRIRKISLTSKTINTAIFGLLGTKRHKTYHCDNCSYEW